MTKPITPEYADANINVNNDVVCDEVVKVFNKMILKKWNGFGAWFHQDEIISAMLESGIDRGEFPSVRGIKLLYENVGWSVSYESLFVGMNHDFVFVFTKNNFKKKEN